MSAKYKIEVGEVIIECVIQGSGQTIVLLPGLGGDASAFTDLAQALADVGFRTVAVNPRGVDASVGPLEKLTLHDLAADIAGVIEALDAAQHTSFDTDPEEAAYARRVLDEVLTDHASTA